MKSITAIVFAVATFLSTSGAYAKDVPLITLTTDSDESGKKIAKIEIPLGLSVADNNPRLIQGVFYVDDRRKIHRFTTEELRQLTLVYKYKKYEAAFVSLSTNPNLGAGQLTVRFLRNAIKGSYGQVNFPIRYNSSMNLYHVINPEDDRPVSQAYIVMNRVTLIGTVGIDYIDMR